MRFIKLWDGIASEWRYSNSPTHGWLFIHCLLEAWHADAKEFKRGTFRTSYPKLSKKTGIGRTKLIRLLKDLSSGDNPELIIKTGTYTQITILNYDKYQSQVVHDTNPTSSPDEPYQSATRTVPVRHANTKEEYRDKKHVYAPRQVEELFVEELNMYPKPLNDFDIKRFNELGLDDKKIIANFASSMGKIWKTHNGEKNVGVTMKLETVINNYFNDPTYITSTDVVKKVLKIDYKKQNKMPTFKEMVASGKIKI
jgi:hypothetical protein